MRCRNCASELQHSFADLGESPPSNAYLNSITEIAAEQSFPLRVWVCSDCYLVQTIDFNRAEELFSNDYAYFSSTSKSWLKHAENFAQMAEQRFSLNQSSSVLEIASNDGYLLQYFKELRIPNAGVEPTFSTASAAKKKGIKVYQEFFGQDFASKYVVEQNQADLIVANNVFAHVPDLTDFCQGLKIVLAPQGTISIEFPHVMQLIEHNLFDTIYHEHFSYFSLYSAQNVLARHGLAIYDLELLETHGGSLRLFVCHSDSILNQPTPQVQLQLKKELEFGIKTLAPYRHFQQQIDRATDNFIKFIKQQRALGKKIIGYGAAAKANTLLNYGKLTASDIEFVVDNAPSKQGLFLPGSHIPILPSSALNKDENYLVIIFPWNIAKELKSLCLESVRSETEFYRVLPQLKKI